MNASKERVWATFYRISAPCCGFGIMTLHVREKYKTVMSHQGSRMQRKCAIPLRLPEIGDWNTLTMYDGRFKGQWENILCNW